MSKEKFQLKSFKEMKSLSEETPCFSASLYYDGKKVCEVSNRGQGGCHDYRPCKGYTYKDIQKLETIAKEIKGEETESLDGLVYDLIEDVETQKYVKKAVKQGFPFVMNVYKKESFLERNYEVLIRSEAFKTKEAMDKQINKNPDLVHKIVNNP